MNKCGMRLPAGQAGIAEYGIFLISGYDFFP